MLAFARSMVSVSENRGSPCVRKLSLLKHLEQLASHQRVERNFQLRNLVAHLLPLRVRPPEAQHWRLRLLEEVRPQLSLCAGTQNRNETMRNLHQSRAEANIQNKGERGDDVRIQSQPAQSASAPADTSRNYDIATQASRSASSFRVRPSLDAAASSLPAGWRRVLIPPARAAQFRVFAWRPGCPFSKDSLPAGGVRVVRAKFAPRVENHK